MKSFWDRELLPRHLHDDEHHHAHSDETPGPSPNGELPRASGRGSVLYLDAPSGLAGDMIVAALLDLGVPFAIVDDAARAMGLPEATCRASRRYQGAIAATQFDVELKEATSERHYQDIVALLARAPIDTAVRELAERVFARLAEAESTVHGIALEEVHFHEVGAADAIVDIVAACACLDYLGAELICSPLPLGRGHVHCRHGVIPLPAPATVLCLRGFETYDGGIDGELVTPTGAAIVGALSAECRRWPEMIPRRVGWGAGHRTLPDRPNALRAVLGEPASGAPRELQTHDVIECNVDDMTGEQIAHTIARLMEDGALDAWAEPIVMKKGRPAWKLAAVTDRSASATVEATLLRESSSIGLRRHGVTRTELARLARQVETSFGAVPVKVSGSESDGTLHVKPEFDVCVALARQHRVPARDVVLAAQLAASHGRWKA